MAHLFSLYIFHGKYLKSYVLVLVFNLLRKLIWHFQSCFGNNKISREELITAISRISLKWPVKLPEKTNEKDAVTLKLLLV